MGMQTHITLHYQVHSQPPNKVLGGKEDHLSCPALRSVMHWEAFHWKVWVSPLRASGKDPTASSKQGFVLNLKIFFPLQASEWGL